MPELKITDRDGDPQALYPTQLLRARVKLGKTCKRAPPAHAGHQVVSPWKSLGNSELSATHLDPADLSCPVVRILEVNLFVSFPDIPEMLQEEHQHERPEGSAQAAPSKPTGSQTRVRRGRRTANACIACRRSKIKCSGHEPCSNCERRVVVCRFALDDQKVTVSKRFIRELQYQARKSSNSAPRPCSQGSADANAIQTNWQGASTLTSPDHDDGPSSYFDPEAEVLEGDSALPYSLDIYTSPFTTTSSIVKNNNKNKRNWIWLAPSSTWSFTARLTLLLGRKLGFDGPENLVSTLWGEKYAVEWSSAPKEAVHDISGLPPLDHALYLYSTVKFHLGQHYRFFDDESFLRNLNEFYCGDALEKVSQCRLWYAQFLLVLAFGNAFLSKSRNPREPPGAKYFVRAMSVLPDLGTVWKDSLLAIEVLAQAALYLYSIDYRESAHIYVGQALRIAQLEGLHTQLPEDEIPPAVITRCRDLWWTLYSMDRHFASSVGIPPSTSDSDVTALKNPSGLNQEDTIFGMQSKLWHLLSTITSNVYRTEKTELGSFLETTMSILHTMAGHAQEIENIFNFQFEGSMDTMSRGTRHITLLYHQCVLVATRPILLSVLHERLDKLEAGEEDWKSFLALTTNLISTGIKSAAKTLQILSHEDSLLEAFLPFDLEFIYGAALHLIMADALFSNGEQARSSLVLAHEALDEMISKGNRVAEVRKSELVRLQELCRELAQQSDQRGLQTLSLLEPASTEIDPSGINSFPAGSMDSDLNSGAFGLVAPYMSVEPSGAPAEEMNSLNKFGIFADTGISSGEFLSIVDHMESQDIFSNGLVEDLPLCPSHQQM